MADMLDYFFRQKVTEAELDLGFTLLEQADRDFANDIGVFGIIDGMIASERAGVPDLTVDLTAPGRAYDQLGQRIFFGTGQNVDLSTDLNGVSTAVSTPGNEKIVSLFIKFNRALSDPRTDGNSQQVFFRRDETFEFVVRQGAEALASTAVPSPLQSGEVLVVDATRSFGQTQILNANLSPDPTVFGDVGRKQNFIFAESSAISVFSGGFNTLAPVTDDVQATLQEVDDELTSHFNAVARRHARIDIDGTSVAGSPNSLTGGTSQAQAAELLGHINDHENDVSAAHAGSAISYAGGGNWADGTTNPATTVELQLDKLVADLAALAGAAKVGAQTVAGSPNALSAGSPASQLSELLGHINDHENAGTGAHAATAVAYASGPSWADGTANPATTVELQLDKLVNDLVAAAGADRIGSAAIAGAPSSITAGSIFNQLAQLLAIANSGAGLLGSANVWTDTNEFEDQIQAGSQLNGTADNQAVARITSAMADVSAQRRTLLWEWIVTNGGGVTARMYFTDFAGTIGGQGGIEIVLNASWRPATQDWIKDNGFQAYKIFIGSAGVQAMLKTGAGAGTTFIDANNPSLGWDIELFGFDGLNGVRRRLTMDDPTMRFVRTTQGGVDTSNPVETTTPTANTIYAKNIVKAWGKLLTQTTTPLLDEGFNLSFAYSGSALVGTYLVGVVGSFDQAVVAMCDGSTPTSAKFLTVDNYTSNGFTIRAFNESGGTMVQTNLNGSNSDLSVICCGEQAT